MRTLVLLALVLTIGIMPVAAAAEAKMDACNPIVERSTGCPVGVVVNRGCTGEPLTEICVYP